MQIVYFNVSYVSARISGIWSAAAHNPEVAGSNPAPAIDISKAVAAGPLWLPFAIYGKCY